MTTNITTIERDGQFWLEMVVDGQPMEPHGPFSTDDEAEATACRFAGICRALNQKVAIGMMQAARRRD